MKLLAAGHLCGGYHSNIDRNHNSLSSAQKLVHCFPGMFYVSAMLIPPCNLDPLQALTLHEHLHTHKTFTRDQGPVVQSIVSLKTS